jgi:hypothetical protein
MRRWTAALALVLLAATLYGWIAARDLAEQNRTAIHSIQEARIDNFERICQRHDATVAFYRARLQALLHDPTLPASYKRRLETGTKFAIDAIDAALPRNPHLQPTPNHPHPADNRPCHVIAVEAAQAR